MCVKKNLKIVFQWGWQLRLRCLQPGPQWGCERKLRPALQGGSLHSWTSCEACLFPKYRFKSADSGSQVRTVAISWHLWFSMIFCYFSQVEIRPRRVASWHARPGTWRRDGRRCPEDAQGLQMEPRQSQGDLWVHPWPCGYSRPQHGSGNEIWHYYILP